MSSLRPRARLLFAQPCLHRSSRSFSTSRALYELQLAYTLHEPPKNKERSEPSDGAPILFLHGLFGSKQNNRTISKVLARDLNRPIYAIDLRNHGESPHHPQHDYVALAKDVETFISTHNLSTPSLIGHSMGAKTVLTLALRAPSLVRDLIAIDNAPVDASLSSDFPKYIQGMREVEKAQVKSQKDADAILQDYAKELPVRQFLMTNLLKGTDGVLKWRIPVKRLGMALDNMADFPFKDPAEARYEGRVLFMRAKDSRYVADETLPIIGRFFPRFDVVDIQAGHWIVSENPEAFRKAAVEFLQEKE
ncbi:alpha/beta-hydrolase [Patellaria atrata CBS 101060]|uniref:Alpha/beta-hydrolase n=1 Tax=Patellaria atrata CBS 101060 TaxID=1346257 RepID=A0A9P4SFR2_9PEZI|nr:alpha/beta-hydrolase [Patellaria atrata CBS 101060]